MIFRQLFDRETSTYTYLLGDDESQKAVLIDPVLGQEKRDLQILDQLGLDLEYIIETHVHADHITAAKNLQKQSPESKILYSKNSGVTGADILIEDAQELLMGSIPLHFRLTPGHTEGCMSIVVFNLAFTGDALFIGGCGRTDFQQGSSEVLYDSIHQKLFTLDENTYVFPGHDYNGVSHSTIGQEKKHNPRLNTKVSKEEFCSIMDGLDLAYPKKIDEALPANIKCGEV